MKFGDNLKNLRKAKNISQEVLADKVGVSRQSVSKWEVGDAYPTMNNILQLCKIFNCTISDLVNDNIIDIDSLDEEVKMSVVKFKSEKQKKVKVLSKIIVVLSKIGRIICKIAIPMIILIMCIMPPVINRVEVKDNNIIINNDDKISIIEKDNNLKIKYDNKVIAEEKNAETVKKIKEVLTNNSKPAIIAYIEIGFGMLVATLVLTIIMLKHLGQLFTNINKGDTPFTLDNVGHIKKMAYYMIALIIIPPISGMMFELLLNTDLNSDFKIFDLVQILFLFIMAYIFEYGYEIQLDSKGKMYGDENE